VGALLALAVAAVHVADQGGITTLASPGWIGWGYRLIEAGGVLTVLTLCWPRPARLWPAWLGWAAGVLLSAGPFAAYVASRTVGVHRRATLARPDVAGVHLRVRLEHGDAPALSAAHDRPVE